MTDNRMIKQTVKKLQENLKKELNVEVNYTTALRIFNNLDIAITSAKKDTQIDDNAKPSDLVVGNLGVGKKRDSWGQKWLIQEKNSIKIGSIEDDFINKEENVYWNFNTDIANHLYIVGYPGRGKTFLVQNIIEKAKNFGECFIFSPRETYIFADANIKNVSDYQSKNSSEEKIEKSIVEQFEKLKDIVLHKDTIDNEPTFIVIDSFFEFKEFLKNYDKKNGYSFENSLEKDFDDLIVHLLRTGRSKNLHAIIVDQKDFLRNIIHGVYGNYTIVSMDQGIGVVEIDGLSFKVDNRMN